MVHNSLMFNYSVQCFSVHISRGVEENDNLGSHRILSLHVFLKINSHHCVHLSKTLQDCWYLQILSLSQILIVLPRKQCIKPVQTFQTTIPWLITAGVIEPLCTPWPCPQLSTAIAYQSLLIHLLAFTSTEPTTQP